MVKFRVGDKVRIRNLNPSVQVDDRMRALCGYTATVETVLPTGAIRLYSFPGFWREYMLEKVEEEEKVERENKWAEVAALFGLQLDEEFDIAGEEYNPYRFTERGLLDRHDDNRAGFAAWLIDGGGKIVKRPFRPRKGENYWYIHTNGTGYVIGNNNYMTDYYRISSGNCYRTREEAEAHVEEWEKKYKEFFND